MRDIGKNIKDNRIKMGLKQEELAEKLFVTRQTVSNYENGKSRPDVEMLIRIAEVFEIDVNTLIYGAEKSDMSPLIKRSVIELAILALAGIGWYVFATWAKTFAEKTFQVHWSLLANSVLKPILFLAIGYIIAGIISRFVKLKTHLPANSFLSRHKRKIVIAVLAVAFIQLIWPAQMFYYTLIASGMEAGTYQPGIHFLGSFGNMLFQKFTMRFWVLYIVYGAVVAVLNNLKPGALS